MIKPVRSAISRCENAPIRARSRGKACGNSRAVNCVGCYHRGKAATGSPAGDHRGGTGSPGSDSDQYHRCGDEQSNDHQHSGPWFINHYLRFITDARVSVVAVCPNPLMRRHRLIHAPSLSQTDSSTELLFPPSVLCPTTLDPGMEQGRYIASLFSSAIAGGSFSLIAVLEECREHPQTEGPRSSRAVARPPSAHGPGLHDPDPSTLR